VNYVVPSSPILITLMKEALISSVTLVLTRTKRRNVPEDPIVHSHCCENLKSYKVSSSSSGFLTLVVYVSYYGENSYSASLDPVIERK
jgi:hypothetical protein